VARVAPGTDVSDDLLVGLQTYDEADRGYTDIEIRCPELYVIVEAKRGWSLPSDAQRRRYVARFAAAGAREQRFVVLTQNGAEQVVRRRLGGSAPPEPIDVVILGWADVVGLVRSSRPTSGSGVGSPAQALELAPEALARPALAADADDPRLGIRYDRRAVVHVAGHRDGGSDTRLDRPDDLDDARAVGDAGIHPIAGPDLRRRLRRHPVHEDVAALAQPGRERACLHEAHRAQPAVDARLVDSAGIGHAFKHRTGREGVAALTAARRDA
jgi:hypothetical protein